MSETDHTPLPWSIHNIFRELIVPVDHISRSHGGSIHEADDRQRFALVIAMVDRNSCSGFAHEISKQTQRANADLIVRSVNALPGLIAALEEIAVILDSDSASRAERITEALSLTHNALALVKDK